MNDVLAPVSFNFDLFKIFYEMIDISKGFVFSKDEVNNRVVLKVKNSSISAVVDSNLTNFNFKGDVIAFADFEDFFGNFKIFKQPELLQDDAYALTLKEGHSELRYRTTDPTILHRNTFDSGRDFGPEKFRFKLDLNTLDYITTVTKKIRPSYVRIRVEDADATITLVNDNGVEASTIMKGIGQDLEEKTIDFKADIFRIVPQGQEYQFIFYERGVIEMKTSCDLYNMSVFTTLFINNKRK